MSRVEAFLGNAVQMAGPLFRLQKRIVAVKLHPDAVSVLQLHADVEKSHLERIVTWSLENDIGRQPVHENYRFLVDQITAAAGEAGIDGVDAGISVPANLFDTRVLTLPYFSEDDLIAGSSRARVLGRVRSGIDRAGRSYRQISANLCQ